MYARRIPQRTNNRIPHADPGRTIGRSGVYKPTSFDSRDLFFSQALEELTREQDYSPDVSRC